MKIAFDHNIFTRQQFGGISRYYIQLIKEMVLLENQVVAFAPFHANEYLKQLNNRVAKGIYTSPGFYKIKGPILLLNSMINQIQLSFWKPDILHETYYAPLNVAPGKTPVVITIHDMTHERYPELFKKNDPSRVLKRRAVQRANAIICISEYTKQDLLHYYPSVISKVHIVKHGFEPLNSNAQAQLHPIDGRPYILFVGGRSGYKNFQLLLDAYGACEQIRNNFHLVAFGGGPWTHAEKKSIAAHRITDKVIQISGDDALLAQFYAHASLFVFPSLYEGFGFPLLESMSMNCPVMCSDTSALPEIAGDAALYFNPGRKDDLTMKMEALLSSDSLRNALIEKGIVQFEKFSWHKCGLETNNIYRQLRNH